MGDRNRGFLINLPWRRWIFLFFFLLDHNLGYHLPVLGGQKVGVFEEDVCLCLKILNGLVCHLKSIQGRLNLLFMRWNCRKLRTRVTLALSWVLITGSLDLCQRDLRRSFQRILRIMYDGRFSLEWSGVSREVQVVRIDQMVLVKDFIESSISWGVEMFIKSEKVVAVMISSNLSQFMMWEGLGGASWVAQ